MSGMRVCTHIDQQGTHRLRFLRFALAAVPIGALCLGPIATLQAQGNSVEGLWSSTVTAPDHPSWRIEDRIFRGGPRVGYDHLKELLSDRANDQRPLAELAAELRPIILRHARGLVLAPPNTPPDAADPATDPATQCEPLDLARILMGPRPFSIEVNSDAVTIHHEEGNTIRRIPIDTDNEGIGPPSRFGTAVARFEGDTLVVESINIAPMPIPIGVTTTSALRMEERYSPDENDPDRLEFELTVDDPGVLREPLILMVPRVRIEGEVFVDPPCELISGQFESEEIGP